MYTSGGLLYLLFQLIVVVCVLYFILKYINFSQTKVMLLGIGILIFLDASLKNMIPFVFFDKLSILGFSLVIVGFISKKKS